MAELGPLMITARNKEQAEYLVRSRAEQRGVELSGVDVTAGSGGMWLVTLTVADNVAGEAARLGDDTQVFHLRTHEPPAASASLDDSKD